MTHVTAATGFRTPSGFTVRMGDEFIGHPCPTRPGHLILHDPGDLPGWRPGMGLRPPCGFLLLAPAAHFEPTEPRP